MIRRLTLLLLMLNATHSMAQNMDELQLDKLSQALREAKADSTRALTYARLAEYYRNEQPDSSLYFGEMSLALSRHIHYPSGEAKALSVLSYYYFSSGQLPKGLELGLEGLKVARENKLVYDQASSLIRIANVYANLRDYKKALAYYHEAIIITTNATDPFFYGAAHWRMADAFAELNEIDSALYYGKKAEEIAGRIGNKFIPQGVSATIGFAYSKKGMDSLAVRYLKYSRSSNNLVKLAIFFKDRKQYDSAIYYATMAHQRGIPSPAKQIELASSLLLSELYASTDPAKALNYFKIAHAAQQSISGASTILSTKAIELEQQERENERQLAELNLRNRFKIIAILAGLFLVLAIALLLYRNYRKAQKANALLEEQKNELHQALSDLRRTQSQLIQSEKMASLGELTAGIAHEIQNPLNFVNNFSEVNKELISELKEAAAKGDLGEINSIATTLEENESKIVSHGKRADAIVKGMLQHSRKSSGQKELTDINALCDEYLRLAYHGLRAKDKSFNAKFETQLDPTLPKISVVPQDIGRVVLNLINNAFYAVSEKQKAESQKPGSTYESTVTVSTKHFGNTIEINVRDNGPGIPDHIKDKIFQPFFTTKPTGQGTGLGLSLSYDIVKSHGGDLRVVSHEGSGAEFTIQLPATI